MPFWCKDEIQQYHDRIQLIAIDVIPKLTLIFPLLPSIIQEMTHSHSKDNYRIANQKGTHHA